MANIKLPVKLLKFISYSLVLILFFVGAFLLSLVSVERAVTMIPTPIPICPPRIYTVDFEQTYQISRRIECNITWGKVFYVYIHQSPDITGWIPEAELPPQLPSQ